MKGTGRKNDRHGRPPFQKDTQWFETELQRFDGTAPGSARYSKPQKPSAFGQNLRSGAMLREEMRSFTAVIGRGPDGELYVGYVPGFPGAHSQGKSLDELQANLREVIA